MQDERDEREEEEEREELALGEPALEDIVYNELFSRVKVAEICDIITSFMREFKGRVRHSLYGERVTIITALDNDLVAFGRRDNGLEVWDAQKGKRMWAAVKHKKPIASIVNLTNGRLASHSTDNVTHIWDDGDCLLTLPCQPNNNTLSTIACVAQGRRIAITHTQQIYVWIVASGKIAQKLVGHTERVLGLEPLSPDDETLVSTSFDATTRVWNTATGECLFSIPVFAGALAAIGENRFAIGGNGKLSVWEKAGACLKSIEIKESTVWASISRMRKNTIAAGFVDGSALVWDYGRDSWSEGSGVKWLKPIATYTVDTVSRIDGTTLALMSDYVRVWDVHSNDFKVLEPKDGMCLAMASLKSGLLIASFVGGTTVIWN